MFLRLISKKEARRATLLTTRTSHVSHRSLSVRKNTLTTATYKYNKKYMNKISNTSSVSSVNRRTERLTRDDKILVQSSHTTPAGPVWREERKTRHTQPKFNVVKITENKRLGTKVFDYKLNLKNFYVENKSVLTSVRYTYREPSHPKKKKIDSLKKKKIYHG